MARVGTLPCKVMAGTPVPRRFKQLKSRYGPRYTKAIVAAAFVALFLPIPGSVLVAIALIVVIAEVHRAMVGRDARYVDEMRHPQPGASAQQCGSLGMGGFPRKNIGEIGYHGKSDALCC